MSMFRRVHPNGQVTLGGHANGSILMAPRPDIGCILSTVCSCTRFSPVQIASDVQGRVLVEEGYAAG